MKEESTKKPPIPLGKALWILSEAFTRDDCKLGFLVETTSSSAVSWHDYIEAWRSVRYNIGKQTEPVE